MRENSTSALMLAVCVNDFKTFICVDRIKIEEDYAKSLSKLSQIPLAAQEEGYVLSNTRFSRLEMSSGIIHPLSCMTRVLPPKKSLKGISFYGLYSSKYRHVPQKKGLERHEECE